MGKGSKKGAVSQEPGKTETDEERVARLTVGAKSGRKKQFSKGIAVALTEEQYGWITTRETEFGSADSSAVVRSLINAAMAKGN